MQEIEQFLLKKKSQEKIPDAAFIKIKPDSGNLLFVDGGNAEIASGADFSIQFIRIAGVVFEGREKKKTETAEFFALIHLEKEKENEKIAAKAKISWQKGRIEINDNDFSFYFMNRELSSFADTIRRVAELKMASSLLKNLPDGGLVVLDGSLETKADVEKKAMDELVSNSRIQKKGICALSKTTSIVSVSGESLPFLVGKNAPKEIFCVPVSDSGNFRTFMLKLHPDSEYIFRCDSIPESADAFGKLSFFSFDPVFLGYPYGLIEADRIARVSNREKEVLRIELAARLGKSWLELEQKERAVNAHRVLDRISF